MSTANAIALAEWMLSCASHALPQTTSDHVFLGLLQAEGMELLGTGYFSAVFTHSSIPGKCIKIVLNQAESDSAPCYLAWARANPGPYVPAVHHLRRNKDGYVVAVLDIYKPLSTNTLLAREFDEVLGWSAPDDLDHPLSKALGRVRKFFDGVSSIDMHSGNVMLDANNQFIITDPISFSSTKESRYMRTGIERALGLAD